MTVTPEVLSLFAHDNSGLILFLKLNGSSNKIQSAKDGS